MKKFKLILFLGMVSILLTACHSKKTFSDKEYLSFIENVLKGIYDGQGNLLNESIDYDVFIDRIQGEEAIFKENKLLPFLQTNFKPGTTMAGYSKDGADIRFIRFYRKNDTAHAIFRTYYNGGISVEDWEFGEKDGKIMINDAFSIVSGIYWSDDWRMKACNEMNVVNDNTILINQLMEINTMISQNAYSEADSAYFWIEQACKKNLYGRTMQLNLASLHKEYEDVNILTKDFLSVFPHQKNSTEFYLLQSAIKHGLVDKAIKHADYLNSKLGNDPIYFVYQSWAYQHAGMNDKTLQCLDSAIHYMPQVYDFYHNKLDVYYQGENYPDFVKQLYVIDSLFSPTDEDIPFFEKNFPKVAETKEFKNWKENRSKPIVNY